MTIPAPLLARPLVRRCLFDDSVHLVGNVSEGKVYLDAGDDSVSSNAGLIAGSIYGGEGTDLVTSLMEHQPLPLLTVELVMTSSALVVFLEPLS